MLSSRFASLALAPTVVVASTVLVACLDKPPGMPPQSHELVPIEPEAPEPEAPKTSATPDERRAPLAPVDEIPVDAPDGRDPTGGVFSLDDALAGLEGSGPLVATITTSHGAMRCSLYEDKAPITVASFVGLARGTRPSRNPDGRWVKKPFYDGTTFHRIIKGFMIQGGDPLGTGAGGPGYEIVDEIWPGATHDRAGLLCMANRGKNTNGSQFFITDAAARQLDGNYTIFGECSPVSVVSAIARVPKGSDDRPVRPVTIEQIAITR